MLLLHFNDNRRCSLEDELFLLERCHKIEDESILSAGKKLTQTLDQDKWFILMRTTYINIHLRASNKKVYKEPVATLIDVVDHPKNGARMTLSHDIFYGRSLCTNN